MSTSSKSPSTIRQGGPGASHENAKAPLEVKKPAAQPNDQRSGVSGGGGEADRHHSHEPERKGGGSRPASTRH
jgi:hypothetical protein